jgi:protein-tyrosine phosphatase
MMHILFVSTGNICRSPTAERLAAAYATRYQIPELTASSAGTRAVIGHPIHSEAARILEQMGGNTSRFAARQLTAKIASTADLIIAMTNAHRDIVLEAAPRQLQRTFTLTEASHLAAMEDVKTLADLAGLRPRLSANEKLDIPDPIGQSPEVFAFVGAHIASLLPPIMEVCRRTIRA